MAKRKKKIIAGNLVIEALYTAHLPLDNKITRREKSKISTQARQSLNLKSARRKLELKLASNFKPTDYHIVFTYDEEHAPTDKKEALKRFRKFIDILRSERKKQEKELKYTYVTEGKHGDKRLHHHMVVNSYNGDFELFNSLWTYGTVNIEYIKAGKFKDRQYGELALYLTKEKDETQAIGSQLWTSSKNLVKPLEYSNYVHDNTTLHIPINCRVLERVTIQNEFGEFDFIKYELVKS